MVISSLDCDCGDARLQVVDSSIEIDRPPAYDLRHRIAGNTLVTSMSVQPFPALNADQVFKPVRTVMDLSKHTIIDPWVRIPLPPPCVYKMPLISALC